MPNDDRYRLFVAVADCPSFAEAARQLAVSPAAITRRIAAIEADLGVRLLSRTTRSVRLTDDGELFLGHARSIVARMEAAEAEMLARTAAPSGLLRVSAPISFGRRHIAPIVARYLSLYPQVQVQLHLSDVSDDLAANEYDLAIRVGIPDKGDYIARRILSARRVVCASPAYLAAFGTPERPEDLAGHRCLAIVRDELLLDRWMFEVDSRMQTLRVPVFASSNSGEVVQAWAEEGLGIALKSRWDVTEALEEGRLVEVLTPYGDNQADIFACYRDRRNLAPRTRAFLDFLSDALAPVERRIREVAPSI